MMITLGRTTLAALMLCNSYHLVEAAHSHLFQLGQKQGNILVEAFKSNDVTRMQKMTQSCIALEDAQFVKLNQTLFNENIDSPAYKKAFAQRKDYFQGLKDTLRTFDVQTLIDQRFAAQFMTEMLNTCDISLAAPNHYEAAKQLGEYTSRQASQYQFPPLKGFKVKGFKADVKNEFYQKGYTLQKRCCDLLLTPRAQGKEVSVQTEVELNQEVSKFLQDEVSKIESLSSSDYQAWAEKITQHIAGLEQALRDYPLEKILEQYKTKKEVAAKLSQAVTLGIEVLSTLKNVLIEGDLSKLANIGTLLQQAGTEGLKN